MVRRRRERAFRPGDRGPSFGTLLDPSDSFNAWYGKDGLRNYSFWDNMEFQALTARIDREIDPAERLPMVHQAEANHGCGNGATVGPVRHRQTKAAATDMLGLPPLRHISTLPK
jgi:hypothetical protein